MVLRRCWSATSNGLDDIQSNVSLLDYNSSTRCRPRIYCQYRSGYPPVIILVYVNDNDSMTLALLRQMQETGPLLRSPIRSLRF
jgi:hypothetical protein